MRPPIRTLAVLISFCVLARGGQPSPQTQAAIPTLPESRGGQDLIGTRMPSLTSMRWIGKRPPELEGSVVLYRWWTDGCPFCARTLPAIEQLRREFGPRGLKVVAVYHPKPPGEAENKKIAQAAARIGYGGAIAIDPNWDALRNVWLSTGNRRATSVSFLVDRQGLIRFVHPGVQFFPSSDPAAAQENADFHLLRNAIATLLPASSPATAPAARALSESDAEEIVAEIPEVGRFMDSVNKNAHGQSRGLLFSQGHPTDAPTQWEIYVGEDRDDDGATCWHRFRVDQNSRRIAIKVSNPIAQWVPLKQWQAQAAGSARI
jgi:thiol-disulfide isomerase/thioredoxin